MKLWTHSKVSLLFLCIALFSLPFSDLSIITYDPWSELGKLFGGLTQLSLQQIESPINVLFQTIAFALLGVSLGCFVGFILAQVFQFKIIQIICALIRSVHELFWALIFLQIFGLHPLTGLLALALPYAATFAKVYAEILEEGDRKAYDAIRHSCGTLSAFFYARLPDLWTHFINYTRYRMECGLRSSAVLGFVGLPTLGYYLSTAFLEGQYGVVWALLLLFYILIASLKFWLKAKLIPFYLLASLWIIDNDSVISLENITRFFTKDIVPTPLKNGGGVQELFQWLSQIWFNEAWPGIVNSLILTQIALVLTALLALVLFPFISSLFHGRLSRSFSHIVLVIMRSTPEYILAFILLTLWGPSMLPAVIALSLHNAGIIAYLMGGFSNQVLLRLDAEKGLNRYFFEVLPRLYGQFLAFLFYRWEIILRETAILGILGIATLGFYIDSAIQDIRMDKAMILILITALLNVCVDAISRALRSKLKLSMNVSAV